MDLSALTLTQLRYVLAVDEHRSFRAAAESCHVSQPALSMQIRRLEDILGVCLFDRGSTPTVPTEIGARVAAQARAVLRECARLPDATQPQGTVSGSYRLAVIPTLARALLPQLVTSFVAQYPRVQLVVEELTSGRPAAPRRRRRRRPGRDAARDPSIRERHLGFERFVYLAPKHPLGRKKAVRQSDLVEHRPWLTEVPLARRCRTCAASTCVRQAEGGVRFEAEPTLIAIVDAGEGLTLLPELAASRLSPRRRKEQLRPFVPSVPVRRISFVHTREHLRRPLADAIFATLVKTAPASLRERADDVLVPAVRPGQRLVTRTSS